MYGAIIGDIAGSRYEGIRGWNMRRDFEFFGRANVITDDTVMTIAVADALLVAGGVKEKFRAILPEKLKFWGRKNEMAGFGARFYDWLFSDSIDPYYSYGNGSAMRVSPCALVAKSMEEAMDLSKISAEVTHNHPEGIKGAQAIAACIYLAGTGRGKTEIREYVEAHFYKLNKTLSEYKESSVMSDICQETVPLAIQSFLESKDFEDAIRNAVELGGDTDTNAAMAGSIAWRYYKRQNGGRLTHDMENLAKQAREKMPDEMLRVIDNFERFLGKNRLFSTDKVYCFYENLYLGGDEFMAKREKDNVDFDEIHKNIKATYSIYWEDNEKNKVQDNILEDLKKKYPSNTDIEHVYRKVALLNDFYSTQIYDTYSVAKHICEIENIEELRNGNLELVKKIGEIWLRDSKFYFYSFATKYCNLHNPEYYPIYDSYVEDVVLYLRNIGKIDKFKNDELKDVEHFKKILQQIKDQNIWDLGNLSLKELDKYLWAIGKRYFPKDYKAQK